MDFVEEFLIVLFVYGVDYLLLHLWSILLCRRGGGLLQDVAILEKFVSKPIGEIVSLELIPK